MTLFLGTLLIVVLCCLGLGVGLLLQGRPLSGGCSSQLPGAARCADCPHRGKTGASHCKTNEEGTNG